MMNVEVEESNLCVSSRNDVTIKNKQKKQKALKLGKTGGRIYTTGRMGYF